MLLLIVNALCVAAAFNTHTTPATYILRKPSTSTTLYANPNPNPTIVTVPLSGSRSYDITISPSLASSSSTNSLPSLIKSSAVLVVTSDKIAPFHLKNFLAHLTESLPSSTTFHTCILPDGEQHKDLPTLNKILDAALQLKLDRKTTFVALGGGVIGDMVGFAASIFLRGVNFIQVPTTVMAMVDSSVGGKTGVNHAVGKNLIGAFYQPEGVFVWLDLLDTLPDRELCSGLSEIVKYGLIRDKGE